MLGKETKVGCWTGWHANGQKQREGEFKSGKPAGLWTYWHNNGQKHSGGDYKNGDKRGRWTFWNQDGSINTEKSGIYEDGKKAADLPKKK